MATTYFGTCNAAGVTDFTTVDDSAGWNYGIYTGKSFTCPGTGPQQLVELSTIVGILSGTPSIRLALYDSLGNMVCQGAATALVVDGYIWQGHMTAADLIPAGGIAGGVVTLKGGQSYRIGVSRDAGGVLDTYNSTGHVLGDVDFGATDYTATGWPSTIPAGTDYDGWITSVRAGVVPFVNALSAGGSRRVRGARGPRDSRGFLKRRAWDYTLLSSAVSIDSTVTAATEDSADAALAESLSTAVTAATQDSAAVALAESLSVAIASSGETRAAATAVETLATAVTVATEDYTALALAESLSTAIAASSQGRADGTLVESLDTAITASGGSFAAVIVDVPVEATSTIDAIGETGSDSVAGVLNPVAPVRTAAGGPTGTKHRKRFIYPEPEPAFAEAAFTPSTPWTPEKDQEPEDDLMSVFAMMIDEDLF